MIFVTVGTQKYQFNRLFHMLDQLVEEEVIKEDIFAQTGYSSYLPKYYESKPFLSANEFQNEILNADIMIAHAGVGSIMQGLKEKRRMIVVPRDPKYKEHIDGHQYEIAKIFSEKKYLLCAENLDELRECILKVRNAKIKNYEAQENGISKIIEQYINDSAKRNVLMVGSDLSVKGGIVTVIKNYLNYANWEKVKVYFVSSHREGTKKEKCVHFLKSLFQIRNLIKKEHIEIVHIHTSERGSFVRKSIILKMVKKKGCKVVLHHHGAEFEKYYQQANKYKKKYIAKTLLAADCNIVLSKNSVSLIQGIAPKARVEVLYNAVPVKTEYQYQDKASDFTMLGRLAERKGTFELLETIQMIDGKLAQNVKFHLCGDGNLEKVQQRIRELGIEHRIGYVGWADEKKKQEILKKTMCHVLFSYNEGLPMSVLETMALGIVNVATNVAAIPEVIQHEKNGFLVEPRDRDALGNILLRISENEEMRRTISEESHRCILERFSVENNVKQLEMIYETLEQRSIKLE